MSTPDLDLTLEVLAHLLCSDRDDAPNPTRAHLQHHHVASSHFDGFEVLDGDHLDPEDFVLLGRNAADLPFWPVDISTAVLANEDWGERAWHFERVRTLDMKQWRGKLRLFSGRMIEEAVLISEPGGKHTTWRRPYALFGDDVREAGSWINGFSVPGLGNYVVNPAAYNSPNPGLREDIERVEYLLKVTAGMSLRRHYLWSVLIGEGAGPRARFVTDPIGVREAFRLRDIPPGKKRRAALLHWVKSHWRKSRSLSGDDRAWVRAYLRGVWSYEWNGLRCQIEPSAEDLATLSAYKEGAA